MAAVLQGLKVVEFTHMVAGPSCGQVLGDLGASVTKVEPPQGDVTRRMGPMAGDVAALYASTNRNKQVVCLDITQPQQAQQARSLACQADVVISNLTPSMLEKAELDGPSLRRLERAPDRRARHRVRRGRGRREPMGSRRHRPA